MKQERDAFGQEIWAYFQNKEAHEIIERDDDFIDLSSGPAIYFSGYEEWPEHEKKAVEFAKGRTLDIGCGAGRHSLYLQQKGLEVTAIDSSPLAIKVCGLRGVKNAKVMSISEIDRFKPGSFDTILMMCSNFGLLGSPSRARNLLKEFHRIASPDALIIAACTDPYKTNDPDHLVYQRSNRRRGRMPGQIRIRVRFKKYVGEWLYYLFVSEKEMAQLLKGTGWRIRDIIESGEAYYVAIIEKE